MKRVAICSYWYPPMQTIASLRIGKFAKYLPDYGWEPFVFTVAPRTDRYTRAGSLPDEAPPGHVDRVSDPSLHAIVDRVFPRANQAGAVPSSHESWRWLRRMSKRVYSELLRFPDESWPWLLRYRRMREAVARVEPDVILSSSPPATTHLIARRLSRELGVPWVADFRDPWSHNERVVRSMPFRKAEVRLELKVIAAARAITTVSGRYRDLLVALHGKQTFVVPNGFDWEPVWPIDSAPTVDAAGRVVLVYTGMLYETVGVPLLFEALDLLLASGRIDARALVVRFFGRNQDVAAHALRWFPRVRPLVELHGEVSHARALAAQREASALLLLESPEPWATGLTPSKGYEYIAAGRPIVATGRPGGEMDHLLRETRTGVVVGTADALAAAVADLVDRFRHAGCVDHAADRATIASYTRRAVTARLAHVLEGVMGVTSCFITFFSI